MRSLSLGIFAVISVCAALGLARAAYVGEPMHPVLRSLATHRIDPAARRMKPSTDGSAYYIVRFKDAPVATYAGGVPGFAATNPRFNGERTLDMDRSASYAAYLDERRGEILDAARQVLGHTLTPRFQYRYALNGISVKLTRTEALRLAMLPGVLAMEPVRHFKPDSVATPASAGDTNTSRAWINTPVVWQIQTTASAGGTDNEGEGIVVADIDTGINDQNSSFAAVGPLDEYTAIDPGSLRFGVCDINNPGQNGLNQPVRCNDKLIGAYTYTFGTNDRNSPEDSEGHGSHTASTMVGDFTTANVAGAGAFLPVSGVAPHASIIAYDVCDPTDLCSDDDSVQAVEQAIRDQATLRKKWGSAYKGMVINFSIGGSDDAYDDPVELAFLSATEAGIYVSAAGGNGGPANVISNDPVNAPVYPVQHVGPWVATNAAATHDGIFSSNSLESFSGGTGGPTNPMVGAGITAGFGPAGMTYAGKAHDPVASGDAPTSGETYPPSQGAALNSQQCLYPFPAHTWSSGTIVVCDRGTNALVDKAYNVQQGGAQGVVIATTSSSSQDAPAEPYVIPGTLLDQSDGDSLRVWLNAPANLGVALSAQISGSTLTTDPSQADQLAGFSSRGPTDSAYDDLVKPDLTAPGAAVLAALSDPRYTDGCSSCSSQPETYGFLDGTSMATPHDTAAAALLMQAHPSWTPAEVKSALMLTAVTVADGTSPGLIDQCASLDSGNNCVAGTGLPSPQVRGAGRIDVDAANRVGVLLDESGADYEAADPDNGGDLTALNLPSFANQDCLTTCSFTRRFTNPFTSTTVTYTLGSADVSPGLVVSFSRNSFTLKPGATAAVTFVVDASDTPKGQWAFADVTLGVTGNGDNGVPMPPLMHMPLAVQSEAPAAHMAIKTTELDYSVSPGSPSTQSFTISNGGQEPLEWKVSSSGTALPSTDVTRSSAPVLDTGAIWTQTASGNDDGFPSTYFTESHHGEYVADTFSLPVNAKISGVVAAGFAQDGSGQVPVAGTVDWYIYRDAAGQPAGDPEDGMADYQWHYSGVAGNAGIDTTNGTITLDLAAAGQPSVDLPAGVYWLIVVPSMDSSESDPNAAIWFWFEGTSPNKSTKGMIDDPSDALGRGSAWTALNASFEFTLSGNLVCSNGSMPGLSISPTAGTVKVGGSEVVNATMSASGLAAGQYEGGICVSGNASDHPTLAVAVSATVTGSSGGSGVTGGGGGGHMGLFGLATLLLAWRRKAR
ncbi:MAG TPA: S8 family serine peptidase [Gammaproteobacteria bacterium]